MDVFSHMFFGFILGHALRLDKKRRTILIIASVFPDLDSLSFVTGWEALFQFHRGPSHSFLCALLIPLAMGMIYMGFLSRKSGTFSMKEFFSIVLICLGGLFGHLFLDLCTPWTTRVLWPFSNEEVTFDITSFFDPIFLAVLFLSSILIMFMKDVKKIQIIAVVALVLISVNFSIRLYEKGEAVEVVRTADVKSVMSVPTYRPDRWWVITETPHEDGCIYNLYSVNSLSKKIMNTRTVETLFINYEGPAEPPLDSPQEAVAYSKKDDRVSAFIRKLRLPAVEVTFDKDTWHIFWYDAFSGVGERMSNGIAVDVRVDGTLTITLSLRGPPEKSAALI